MADSQRLLHGAMLLLGIDAQPGTLITAPAPASS